MAPRDRDAALRGGALNLDNYRHDPAVVREVEGLLRNERLEFLAYQEGAEYADDLARIKGYDQHTTRGRGGSARDAGILTHRAVETRGYRLARTRQRWPKDKAPGLHWPRAFPSIKAEWVRIVSVHMPRQIHTVAYHVCWLRLLTILLTTRGPIALVGDWNKGAHRKGPFTPRLLARLTGCKIVSEGGIDYLLVRGCDAENLRHVDAGDGDHDAIVFDLVPA